MPVVPTGCAATPSSSKRGPRSASTSGSSCASISAGITAPSCSSLPFHAGNPYSASPASSTTSTTSKQWSESRRNVFGRLPSFGFVFSSFSLPSAPPPFSSPTSAFFFCAASIIFFLTFLTRFGFGETPNFFLTGERFVFSGCRTAFFFLSSFSLSGARLNWLSFSSSRTLFFLGMRFGGRARHFCVNVKMGSSSESLASKPELHASGSRWKLPAMI